MQYFVECRQPVEVNMLQFVSIFLKTQPVKAGDEIKNMRKLGELDSGHREEIPKPRRRGNLYNERVIATLTMEHFHYEVYFLTTAAYMCSFIFCEPPLKLDNIPGDELHPKGHCVSYAWKNVYVNMLYSCVNSSEISYVQYLDRVTFLYLCLPMLNCLYAPDRHGSPKKNFPIL